MANVPTPCPAWLGERPQGSIAIGMFGFRPFVDHPHLASILREHWKSVPLVAVFAMVIGLLESAGIGMLIPLLSTLSSQTASMSGSGLARLLESIAVGLDPRERLFLIAGVILALVMCKNVIAAGAATYSAALYGRIAADIRDALSRRLESASFAFHLRADTARLVQILGTESWQAADAARAAFGRIGSAATVCAFGAMLLLVEWRLSLLVLAGAIVTRLVQSRFERLLRRMSHDVTGRNNELAARMMFAIFGARVIRLFDQNTVEQARFEAASDRLRQRIFAIERLSGWVWPALETLHAVLFLVVLIVAVSTGVPLAVLATFLVLLNRVQPHLRAIEQSAGAYAAASGQLGEVEWLLDPVNTPEQPVGTLPYPGLRREIRFDRVSYSYDGESGRSAALSDVTFTLAKGRTTALLGRSGSGKSTVVSLLCGLLQPTSGTILIDGVPLSELRSSAWLERLAVAGQDVELFDGTIADNISFGAAHASREDVARAAEQAQARFVDDLPDGLDTRVGDRGTSLSGGQRQRIGIARALLRQPEILIFDEATSAVDRLAEGEIVDVIRALRKDTTVLMISHRSDTLRHCEDGIVLKDGMLVEVGPLHSLREFKVMEGT